MVFYIYIFLIIIVISIYGQCLIYKTILYRSRKIQCYFRNLKHLKIYNILNKYNKYALEKKTLFQ